jgi:uncharacterized protein
MSKLVLVTGASSGIGEATARLYGRKGANVLLLARNRERLDRVAAAIAKDGGGAAAYPVDLADARAIAEVSARIDREHGVPDILINNAGAGSWKSLLDTSAEEALAMIEVPYLAAFNLTRAVLPGMIARGSGAIACISSPASYLVWPKATAYIAARHAMLGFTEALRADLKGTGVNVTLVVLGTVETPYWEHNPGSRENLPAPNAQLVPVLTPDEAAQAIYDGVARGKRTVFKPGIFRALVLLNAIAPRAVAKQLRRTLPKHKPDSATS